MAGRARFHARTPEQRQEMYRKANLRKRRETKERKQWALRGIDILRKRGFDMSDIAAIGHMDHNNVARWVRGECLPGLMAEEKIALLLQVTSSYATSDTVTYRKRRPHPDRERLRALAAPGIADIEARRNRK